MTVGPGLAGAGPPGAAAAAQTDVRADDQTNDQTDVRADVRDDDRTGDRADDRAEAGPVHIIEVKGRLDPILAAFVAGSLQEAQQAGAEVLVMQVDSPGDLIGDQHLAELVFRVAHAPVPVAAWVGPTGSRALGGAAELVTAADVSALSPRSRIGRFDDVEGSLGPDAAVDRGVVDLVAPTLGELLAALDGRELDGRVLETVREVSGDGGRARTEAAGDVRLAELPLVERLLHATASPSVAYLLLVAGLSLIVFEFFSVGVGAAGATGALALVLSAYGLAVLPTRPLGLALVGLGMFGFSVDVQAGAPRTWTVIGTASLVAGSAWLFGGGLHVPWLTLVAIVAGVLLLVLVGLPSTVRSRFATPTIGRESMIGEMGQARTAVDPEGTVELRGGLWRARTNRATPIGAGEPVRVVAIDGLLLEVEPEEGGARDAGH